MPTWLAIVLLVLLAAIVLTALGGVVAAQRRRRAGERGFHAALASVDQALAAAHAQDRGWDPAVLEAAAREAFATAHPGVEPREVVLTSVIDRPGTDDDRAVFRFATEGGHVELTLGRSGDAWSPAVDAPSTGR